MQNILTQLLSCTRARLIFQNQSFSAQQLLSRAIEIAQELEKMQCGNRHIAFWMPNSPELLCWYIACFYKGISIVPIIYEQTASVVQQTIQLTDPIYLFTTSEKQQELEKISCHIKIIDDTYKAVLAEKPRVEKINPSTVKPEQLAMIIFSSGTTGVLKGIMHSYQSAHGFLEGLVEVLAVTQGLTYVVAQPMGHIGGIVTTLLTLLHNGTAILLQKFDLTEYMQTLERYQPTHINLHTPLFYEIINYPKLDKKAFNNIVTSFAGGDDIPADLPAQFTEKTGAPMQIGYGATETGIIMVNRDPYDAHKGSVGKKVTAVSTVIELRNENGENGKIVAPGQPGEIWTKSATCCLGYWQLPELNQQTLVEGWFRTGDIAYQDTQGYYWYRGRASQIIHRGSQVIYPEYIEQILFNYPAVKIVAVISEPDSKEGEVPIAFVELKSMAEKDDIMRYAAQHLQPWCMPARLIILSKMPLNLTGKIDRGALKQYLKT